MITPDKIFKAQKEKEMKINNLINAMNRHISHLKKVSYKLRKYERNESFGAW